MLQHNPDYKYKYHGLYKNAIKNGSLDVLKQLHRMKKVDGLDWSNVSFAISFGQLETTKWIAKASEKEIDWNSAVLEAYKDRRSYKVIEYLREKVGITLPIEARLCLLVAEDNFEELQAEYKPNLTTNFPWNAVINAAVQDGRTGILDWAYNISKIFPQSDIVEKACELGNDSALRWVFETNRARIVPTCQEGCIGAFKCFVYAVMHEKEENMKWIVENPLKNALPSIHDAYLEVHDVPEEAHLKALKWIAEKGTTKVDSSMMIEAATEGHVQIFLWLYRQGLPITKYVVETAAEYGRVGILKAVSKIDSSLVHTMEIANLAAVDWGFRMRAFDVLYWMWKMFKILPNKLEDDDVKEWVEYELQKESLRK
jgi:hypothetical protein